MKLILSPCVETIQDIKDSGLYDHISIFGKHRVYCLDFNDDKLDTYRIDTLLKNSVNPIGMLNSEFKDYDFYKLYLYNHSIQRIELTKSCDFDSGLYGVIAINKLYVKASTKNKRYFKAKGLDLIKEFVEYFNKVLVGDYDYYNAYNEDYEYIDSVLVSDKEKFIKEENNKGNTVTIELWIQ